MILSALPAHKNGHTAPTATKILAKDVTYITGSMVLNVLSAISNGAIFVNNVHQPSVGLASTPTFSTAAGYANPTAVTSPTAHPAEPITSTSSANPAHMDWPLLPSMNACLCVETELLWTLSSSVTMATISIEMDAPRCASWSFKIILPAIRLKWLAVFLRTPHVYLLLWISQSELYSRVKVKTRLFLAFTFTPKIFRFTQVLIGS